MVALVTGAQWRKKEKKVLILGVTLKTRDI
jgi:hypothetical protein